MHTPSKSPIRSPLSHYVTGSTPTKRQRLDASLSLQRVVGLTCTSAACFDVHAPSRTFACTAGATVVLSTVDRDRAVSQRFLRATQTSSLSTSWSYSASATSRPLTPTSHHRPLSRGRDDSPLICTPSNRDSPRSSHNAQAERVKPFTALSISPNGKWVAVGESGYKPRVIIFDVHARSPHDNIVSTISEHSFGLQFVAYSPDSRLLATLGTINDGFLHIWLIDNQTGLPTLLATNKCTNIVRHVCWMGRALICVGVRFIKIWRPDERPVSPTSDGMSNVIGSGVAHMTLAGKNVLLGALIETTFTAVAAKSATVAIVCTDAGEIYQLEDDGHMQCLTKIASVTFPVSATEVTSARQLIVAGANDQMQLADLPQESYLDVSSRPVSRPASPIKSHSFSRPTSPVKTCNVSRPMTPSRSPTSQRATIAVGVIDDIVVAIDSSRTTNIYTLETLTESDKPAEPRVRLSSSSSGFLGARALHQGASASFLTWSGNGIVTGWSRDGDSQFCLQTHTTENAEQDLRTVSSIPGTSLIIAGDSAGILSIFDTSSKRCIHTTRAHASHITDIVTQQDTATQDILVISASRDRTVQVFAWQDNTLSLLQTLDEHIGAVTSLLITPDGSRLLSMSADRTIVVRSKVAQHAAQSRLFDMTRTITFKSGPSAMQLTSKVGTIAVATQDKSIQLIDIDSGAVFHSFRAGDKNGLDGVNLSSIAYIHHNKEMPLIAGVSNSDKSVRLYNEDGTLLAHESGHTEGISGLVYLNSKAGDDGRLVSVAADGTIYIWNITHDSVSDLRSPNAYIGLDSPITSSPLSRPPLRKVFSMSGIKSTPRRRLESTDVDTPDSPSRPQSYLKKKPSKLDVRGIEPPRLRTQRSTVDMTRSSNIKVTGNTKGGGTSPGIRVIRPSMQRSITSGDTIEGSEAVVSRHSEPDPAESNMLQLHTTLVRDLQAYRSRLAATTVDEMSDLLQKTNLAQAYDKENVAESDQEESLQGLVRDENAHILGSLAVELQSTLTAVRARLCISDRNATRETRTANISTIAKGTNDNLGPETHVVAIT